AAPVLLQHAPKPPRGGGAVPWTRPGTRPKHTRAYPRAHPVIVPLTLWSLRYWTRHGRRPARAGTSTARVGSVPITSPRHGPDPRHPRGRDRYGEDRSTVLPVPARPEKGELKPVFDLFEQCDRVAAHRDQVQVGHPGLPERFNPFAHIRFGAHQVRQLDHLVGHRRGSLLLLACQVEVLDPLRGLLVAVAAGHRVVEVLALRAHAAHVQRDHRTGQVQQLLRLLALADREQAARGDL